jgi:hypothetical protein
MVNFNIHINKLQQGTIITEHWTGGEPETQLLVSKFDSEQQVQVRNINVRYRYKFTLPLVLLSSALGFDGWFVNMESKLPKEFIEDMKGFLEELTRLVKQIIHLEHAYVYWYDSLTEDGELDWQNVLNERNQAFFVRCDGLFTNYWWNEQGLASTADLANQLSGSTAVYSGIDIFGRGPQPGGFDSFKVDKTQFLELVFVNKLVCCSLCYIVFSLVCLLLYLLPVGRMKRMMAKLLEKSSLQIKNSYGTTRQMKALELLLVEENLCFLYHSQHLFLGEMATR